MSEYKVSLITYLDVLGFRDLLMSSKPGRVEQALLTMRQVNVDNIRGLEYGASYYRLGPLNYRSFSFSDLTVRAVPTEWEDLGWWVACEVDDLCYVQKCMCLRGTLIRGAITVGPLVAEKGVVFGPALVRAHDLERVQARYPRIIIDPEIFGHLPSDWPWGSGLNPCIGIDRDGERFVDYLRWSADEKDLGFFDHHKSLILEKAYHVQGTDKVADKYRWLASYHNSAAECLDGSLLERKGYSRPDMLIGPQGAQIYADWVPGVPGGG